MTPTTHKKSEGSEEKSSEKEGRWEREVRNPVDDYPERPLEEAREGQVNFDPSKPEDREKYLYYEHEVGTPGDLDTSRLRLNELGKKTKGSIPHGDYVESKDAFPGYNPPVYD